ncbi:MAG TPA: Gfo/Idh/MocA family oxidoreductase [Syntrophorhabdaceae bacterium]|nr:Gfo/Idh/MocA family oxidoreductase [Syntrophorhabdaceae bacterium]
MDRITGKVKFAIIGCGRISYRHIEAIQENNDAQLVALCDLNLERANEMNGTAHVKVYEDYREMFSAEDIDVACIMTPSGMHAEHAIDIITSYRKHIVLEKPMCLRVSDGLKLIDTARSVGVRLFIVHQNRFNKAIQKIKTAIDNDLIGRIAMATVRIRWSRGQSYYDRDPWRGTWALDGGALTNQAIHHIDLLRWLTGAIKSLSAVAKTQFVNVAVEDTACAWLKFKNGALGAIEATTATRPLNKDLEASISILGENGTVIVEGAAVNKLTLWTFDDTDTREFSEDPPNVYGFGHNHIIDNVVDVLKNGGEPLVSGEDAIESIKLLSALYRSIEEDGREVSLKDDPVSGRLGVIDAATEKIANLYRTDAVMRSRKK